MSAEDWPEVARIYRAGIATGNATFESIVPDWERWRASRLAEPCLIARQIPHNQPALESAEDSHNVLGWAALTAASSRPVYRGVAEVSIYVDPDHARHGVGRTLLLALVEASEHAGLWTLRAGIFPENEASIALHESCGFRLLGTHERVGQMPDGRWRDVVLYERRSEVVGTGS
jgi:L-amino acid N-acyltransferase YncA